MRVDPGRVRRHDRGHRRAIRVERHSNHFPGGREIGRAGEKIGVTVGLACE